MHRGPCGKHKSTSANRSFRHYLNESMVSQKDPSLSSNLRAKSFVFYIPRDCSRASSASGEAAGGGKERPRWGLAASSRCCAWPWPAKQQAAAAQQLSSLRTALPATAASATASTRWVSAPPRAWGGGRSWLAQQRSGAARHGGAGASLVGHGGWDSERERRARGRMREH